MHCPDCGKDCADAKFCPECGRNLLHSTINTEMPAAVQTECLLSTNVQPDCSNPSPQPPMGRYKSTYGYMELSVDAVTFHKKVLFRKKTIRTIPYSEIAKVSYMQAKRFKRGYLSVREWKDRDSILPTLNDATVDPTSIDFVDTMNEAVYQVYRFFTYCAEKRSAAEKEKAEQTQPLSDIPDLDYYYQKYKLSRENAIMALRIDTGMSFRDAKANIDLIFDFHDSEQARNNNGNEEILCCPKCWSTDVTVGKRGFDLLNGCVGNQIFPGGGFLLGMAGAEKTQCVCENCGHKWLP